MTPEQFVYWLQGYFEVTKPIDNQFSMTPEQIKVITEHLDKVFNRPKGLKPTHIDIYDEHGNYQPDAKMVVPNSGYPLVIFPDVAISC